MRYNLTDNPINFNYSIANQNLVMVANYEDLGYFLIPN